MWWTRVAWASYSVNPLTNKELRWGKMHGYARIFIEGISDDVIAWELSGATFHPSVQSGQHRMPCLTTPAPGDRGRPAPN